MAYGLLCKKTMRFTSATNVAWLKLKATATAAEPSKGRAGSGSNPSVMTKIKHFVALPCHFKGNTAFTKNSATRRRLSPALSSRIMKSYSARRLHFILDSNL